MISDIELYQIVRGQLEHEDNLITNRLNWFITSQSFLFTAYAILANGLATPGPAGTGDARRILLLLIPGLSIVTSLLVSLSIFSGIVALKNLRKFFTNRGGGPAEDAFPPVQGYRSTRTAGLAAPVLLPMIFMGVWLYLLARRLF